MNERIKQMIDERGMYHDSELYEIAEAVIRECGQLALDEQQRYRNISHRDMNECAVAMSNYQLLLKEHFGVKE